MGLIFKERQDLIKDYSEETITWENALILPGQSSTEAKLASFSKKESELLLLKLDTLVMDRANPIIASIVAEEADSILTLVRMVKTETKEEFKGILGAGANLDINWLRAKHIGSSILTNKDASANCYLYGSASVVTTWLHTISSTGSTTIVPEQTMTEEAGMIYLGAIDPIETPKYDAYQFTIAGIPAPAQTLTFVVRGDFGNYNVPVVRFEKPVIIGPEKKQKLDLYAYATGDTKFEPIAFIVTKAELLSL